MEKSHKSKRYSFTPELEGGLAAPISDLLNCLMSLLKCKYALDNAYRSYADRVTGPWRDSLVEHWQEHAKDERDHAYDLAMKIMGFGADPNVGNIPLPYTGNALDEMCASLISMELETISKARGLINMAGENTALKVMAENIALLDTHHLDDLRRMCGVEL